MFELFQLVISSPLGAFVLAGLQDVLYAVVVATDCEDCGFNDLGKLLFGGVFAAIVVGVGISVVLRRIKDKGQSAADLVSIRVSDDQ